MGNSNRCVDVTQRIFHHNPVVLAAKDEPDTWIVARLTILVIQRREVEVHLARVLRLERARLQIHCDEAAQPSLVE